MRSSHVLESALWMVFGLSTAVSANSALATLSPCPSCPKSCAPAPITVTSQYQAVSTCTPTKECSKATCKTEPSCSTYKFVKTVIPCMGGESSTSITKIDDIVTLEHISTVVTSILPCSTTAPSWNGTAAKYSNSTSTSTKLETMVVDVTCPYSAMGPMAMGGYSGSGLCTTCAENSEGSKSQVVGVSRCLDGHCSTYSETWISTKYTPASTVSTAAVTNTVSCSSSGVNTIPMTATITPNAPGYSSPVTTTYLVTTSVPAPQVITVTTYCTVTFSQPSSPPTSSSISTVPMSASTICSSNGVHTIPMVTTCTPTAPGFTEPVASTVYYTTTVTNAPIQVDCTTTITVTFIQTTCPVQTVVSGTTMSPTIPATTPASVSAGPTTPSSGPSITSGNGGSTTMATLTTPVPPSGTSATPSSPPTVGPCDYQGCYGSTDMFEGFERFETSGTMTIELCTSECSASGFEYAGLDVTDCYCAKALENCSEMANGVCSISCPGNPMESCGGNEMNGKLMPIYECPLPTTTTTTTSETSTTTSSTPDVSSDPDPEPEKRNIQADMEISARRVERDNSSRLRRGGMLRIPGKSEKGIGLNKRDFGLKKPFGM